MQGFFWLGEELSASHKGHCSMELLINIAIIIS